MPPGRAADMSAARPSSAEPFAGGGGWGGGAAGFQGFTGRSIHGTYSFYHASNY
jgi:hypothetical protein